MAAESGLRLSLAVLGAGWAGLAAAIRAAQAGHAVAVFEMAAQPGGRARSMPVDGRWLDNGQHIMIGAYTRCLALLHDIGVDVQTALQRQALTLRFPDGRGLSVPAGASRLQLLMGLWQAKGWSAADRGSLLRHVARWVVGRFRCDPGLSVDALCAGMTRPVRELLIEPLCVSALNTPAAQASAAVFLRVLHDALLGPRGSGDLLLPKLPLSTLLADPAVDWLRRHDASVGLSHRVKQLSRDGQAWLVDGQRFDAVIIATSSLEAARLVEPLQPRWSSLARSLEFESIVTVLLHSPGSRLPAPMLALHEGPAAPAQFLFDHGALGLEDGRFAAVVSGANRWLDEGIDALAGRVQAQVHTAMPAGTWCAPPQVLKTIAEKRATFRCVPGLQRPPAQVAEGLWVAGDYVDGPYPATLEGAVRSGEAAVSRLQAVNSRSVMQKPPANVR